MFHPTIPHTATASFSASSVRVPSDQISHPQSQSQSRSRGMVLVAVMLVLMLLAVIGTTLLNVTVTQEGAAFKADEHMSAVYIADSGISVAVNNLNNSGTGIFGTKASPVSFGGGTYYTTATANADGSISIIATATYGNFTRALNTVAFRVPVPASIFTYGVFSNKALVVSSNALVDSFKSSLGSYASQITGSYHGQAYGLTNGSLGSNAGISLDSNGKVFGNANPGPSNAVTVSANVNITGNQTALVTSKTFPPIVVPTTGTPTTVGNIAVGTTKVVGPGNLSVASMVVDGTLVLKGPATVVVGSLDANSNSHFYIDSSNGPVTLYGTGTFNVNSNVDVIHVTPNGSGGYTQQASPSTSNFAVNLTGTFAKLCSNNTFYGTVYAPNGTLELDSNGGFFGAAVADQIILDSNFGIHYDESLNDTGIGSTPKYRIVSWREVVPQ